MQLLFPQRLQWKEVMAAMHGGGKGCASGILEDLRVKTCLALLIVLNEAVALPRESLLLLALRLRLALLGRGGEAHRRGGWLQQAERAAVATARIAAAARLSGASARGVGE